MPSHRVLIDLTRRYSEPHRHYHNIEHIAWMFNLARDLELSEEQILAIWFHDAVFDTASDSNEEDSAQLARDMLLAEGYPEDRIAVVERIILDTKAHKPTVEPAELVIDLDLASLSFPWETFMSNTEKVRLEYAALPDDQLATGRSRLFEDFLSRDRIYSTAWGARLEQRARENLQRALDM